jgi:hypothetical protein
MRFSVGQPLVLLLLLFFPAELVSVGQEPPAISLRLVVDQAESVLSIVDKLSAAQHVTEGDWNTLFQSEGYRRLKAREQSMNRDFDDKQFRTFVLSAELVARRTLLKPALDYWKSVNLSLAGSRTLDYLPAGARIRAKVYPVIKPRDNSFVFDMENDPAIFFALDPVGKREEFENTLVHELHHVGYASSCPPSEVLEHRAKLGRETGAVLDWLGAFGEGFAMLAAAGSPQTHPHAASADDTRVRWDRDVGNFEEDFRRVERFFLDILNRNLVGDKSIREAGFRFFGVQGPWYTVGWRIAKLIEESFGREELIECMCDRRKLLAVYNRAADKQNQLANSVLPLWSPSLTDAFSNRTPAP